MHDFPLPSHTAVTPLQTPMVDDPSPPQVRTMLPISVNPSLQEEVAVTPIPYGSLVEKVTRPF